MRTNIILNDELMGEAMRYSRARTKRAVVEEALETYVAVKKSEQNKASYKERLEQMRKKLAGVRLDESSVDMIRRDRERTA
jgi:Arc/MetJ family transcription regulator